MNPEIQTLIGGILLTIIAYFLKATMNDLKETKELSLKTKSELDILKNDHTVKHDHMSENFNRLESAIKDLIVEIKELNKEISVQKKNENYKG